MDELVVLRRLAEPVSKDRLGFDGARPHIWESLPASASPLLWLPINYRLSEAKTPTGRPMTELVRGIPRPWTSTPNAARPSSTARRALPGGQHPQSLLPATWTSSGLVRASGPQLQALPAQPVTVALCLAVLAEACKLPHR
jgi:hypothetical protein